MKDDVDAAVLALMTPEALAGPAEVSAETPELSVRPHAVHRPSRLYMEGEKHVPLPSFRVRDMLVTDLHCILKDWMMHYRRSMSEVPDRVYFAGMQKRVARHARTSKTLLAVDVDPTAAAEKRDILGWICFKLWDEKCIICHYVYVKPKYRGQGLGRALFVAAGWKPGTVILSGHKWRAPPAIAKRLGYFHNPFLLEEILEW